MQPSSSPHQRALQDVQNPHPSRLLLLQLSSSANDYHNHNNERPAIASKFGKVVRGTAQDCPPKGSSQESETRAKSLAALICRASSRPSPQTALSTPARFTLPAFPPTLIAACSTPSRASTHRARCKQTLASPGAGTKRQWTQARAALRLVLAACRPTSPSLAHKPDMRQEPTSPVPDLRDDQ